MDVFGTTIAKLKDGKIVVMNNSEVKSMQRKNIKEVITHNYQIATENKEPYFNVVGFHHKPENGNFGFWELDWNEYKVLELKSLGYYGESDEEVIDRWFTEICRESARAEGINMDRRHMGFIDVKNIGNGRSEVS